MGGGGSWDLRDEKKHPGRGRWGTCKWKAERLEAGRQMIPENQAKNPEAGGRKKPGKGQERAETGRQASPES